MSWRPEYVLLIIFSTLVDYIAGLQIHKSKKPQRKKVFLSLSILVNLGLLFTFKYFNFFSESVRQLLAQFSIPMDPILLKVMLPVGISFYTFQTLSYTIDIYRGKIKPEKHLGIFAVYVSFFPQLVAGPIERAKNLIPQFFEKHKFDYARVTDGLKLMLWGFYKKLVIADLLAIAVNTVYSNPTAYTGTPLLLATFFFAVQVYCDFSGYSDIAIGAAKIMGFRLMDNFDRPYAARSIAEFWRRWHISLSSWFQDYVFTPLYFYFARFKSLRNLKHTTKHNVAFVGSIIIGLTLLGLWHGADWTFFFLGLYNGTLIAIYHLTKKYWNKLNPHLQIVLTFCIVVYGFILFRADNLSDAIYIMTHIFSGIRFETTYLGIGWGQFIVAWASIALLEFVHAIEKHRDIRSFLSDKPRLLRWSIYTLITLSILIFGTFQETPFIYFQF